MATLRFAVGGTTKTIDEFEAIAPNPTPKPGDIIRITKVTRTVSHQTHPQTGSEYLITHVNGQIYKTEDQGGDCWWIGIRVCETK